MPFPAFKTGKAPAFPPGGQQKPPFRAKPGGMKPPMMADGGFGAPAPIGGGPPAAGPAGPAGPGAAAGAAGPPMPGNDDKTGATAPKPEAVNYHDDLHTCQTCEYMGDDGQCSVLLMQVSPEGACNAFEAKAGDNDDQGEGFGGGGGGGEMAEQGPQQ